MISDLENKNLIKNMKTCSRCKLNLPITSFKLKKNGEYTTGCEKCREKDRITASQKRKAKLEEKISEGNRRCIRCCEILSLDNFKISKKGCPIKTCNTCEERNKKIVEEKIQNAGENRLCVRCKLAKPLQEFVLKKKYSKQCKSCIERLLKYRKKHSEKISQIEIPDGNKLCGHCKKIYPLEQFRDRPTGGKTANCIKCMNYANDYLEKNRCIHGKKNKSACKECKGASICEHNRTRTYCPECKGGSLCEHKKRKDRCAECEHLYGRNQYCEHKRLKTSCTECESNGICEHKKRRSRCVICGGGSICEHKIQRDNCRYCDFAGFLCSRVRATVGKAIKNNNGKKTKRSLQYLCCDIETYKKYLEDQFIEGMSWENYGTIWEIDHIVPLKYENPTIEQVIERLHYTNTQPLWQDVNSSKGNRFIYKLQQAAENVQPSSPLHISVEGNTSQKAGNS